MNSYIAIFIPKINNKLGQIIKGFKLLNLINNKINIQNGGSPWSDVINKFAGNTHYIYDTEEYEKLVARLVNEIALLRAVVIELLSKLPEKEKPIIAGEIEKIVQKSAKQVLPKTKESPLHLRREIEGLQSLLDPPKIDPPKIIPPKIIPPKIEPPKELTKDNLFMNTLTLVYDDDEKNIKIYKFTKNTYKYIDSDKFTKDTLWSADINNKLDSKYKEENMEDIYILFVSYNGNSKYVFSFKHNDLRDMKNNQLKLEELYYDLCDNKNDCNKLRDWFTINIKEYVNSHKIERAPIPKLGTTQQTIGSDNYHADSCKKYDIIFKNDTSFYETINHLKITDKKREYNNITLCFESVPFYVDIYDFISKFTNINKLSIIGDFNKDFNMSYKTYVGSTSTSFEIDPTHTNDSKFNEITQLICDKVEITILDTIIKLFKFLKSITIKGTYDSNQQKLINIVITTLCKRDELDINIPNEFKATLQKNKSCTNKTITYIDY